MVSSSIKKSLDKFPEYSIADDGPIEFEAFDSYLCLRLVPDPVFNIESSSIDSYSELRLIVSNFSVLQMLKLVFVLERVLYLLL